jgi:hypothetical protein
VFRRLSCRVAVCALALCVCATSPLPAGYAQSESTDPRIATNTAELEIDAVIFTLRTTLPRDAFNPDSPNQNATVTYGMELNGARNCGWYDSTVAGIGNHLATNVERVNFSAISIQTQRGLLPPNARLWWTWRVVDESGAVIETPRQTIVINPSEARWRTLSLNDIVLHTTGYSLAQSADLMKRAQKALRGATDLLGAKPAAPVQIWIFPTEQAYRSATKQSFDDWSGGYALTTFNTVLGVVEPGNTKFADELLTHEIGHIVTYTRNTSCGRIDRPTWLIEGIAVSLEPNLLSQPSDSLKAYINARYITSLRAMQGGFSSDAGTSSAAYEYSGHVVGYLIKTGGRAKLQRLLDALNAGARIDNALTSVYGFDTDGLDARWRASAGIDPPVTVTSTPNTAWPTRAPVPTIPIATAVTP